MEPHQRFGRNVRQARVEARLSQGDLGRAAGLHRTEISLLERGVRQPRLSTIVRLAGALDIAPSDLLRGINGAPPRSLRGRRPPAPRA